MATYKQELVERSNERAMELIKQIEALDDNRRRLKVELSEVKTVLRALGATDRIPIATKLAEKRVNARETGDTITFTYYNQNRRISKAIVAKIQAVHKQTGVARELEDNWMPME